MAVLSAFLREQQIKDAGPELVEAVQADPNAPVTTESQSPVPPEVADDVHWAASLRRNEAWLVGEDIARSAVQLPRNLAANMLGEVSDVAQLVTDLGGAVRKVRLGADPLKDTEIDVPFTSDEIVEAMGGDKESTQFMLAGLIPTPGGSIDIGAELVGQAIAIGAIAARRKGGPILQRLNDFLGMGGNDLPNFNNGMWQKTGWYNGADGAPRFYLSDASSTVNASAISTHPRVAQAAKAAKDAGQPMITRVSNRLEDVLVHPELYDLYPELAGTKVTTWVITKPDGSIAYRNLTRSAGFKGGVESSRSGNVIRGIEMGNLDSTADFHETILHEAQHIVQSIEGFAQGTAAHLSLGMVQNIKNATIMKRATALIDEGAKTPDELFLHLRGEGFDESLAQRAVQDNNIQQYIQASAEAETGVVDDLTREFMFDHQTNVGARFERANSDVVHTLNFLFKGDVPEDGAVLLSQLQSKLSGQELSNVGFQAYLHSAGEAEARLTGLLREMTDDQIKLLNSLDPAQQAEITQALSVGPRRPAGTATIIEQPTANPPVSGPLFEEAEEAARREAIRASLFGQQ